MPRLNSCAGLYTILLSFRSVATPQILGATLALKVLSCLQTCLVVYNIVDLYFKQSVYQTKESFRQHHHPRIRGITDEIRCRPW